MISSIRAVFVLAVTLITVPSASLQEKPANTFDSLRGEWELPVFKEGDREHTIRLHFTIEHDVQVLKHSWTTNGFFDKGTAQVAASKDKDQPVLQFFNAIRQPRASVPYEIKGNILRVDAVALMKLLVRDTVRERFEKRWAPLLKDKKEWRRVESKP